MEPTPRRRGLSAQAAEAEIRRSHGEEWSVVAIGRAGENLVPFALMSHDGRHAGRGGTGAVMGAPTVISTRSGSDFDSSQAFGVAGRDNGSLLVVWHSCLDKGDGNGCGVFGRLIGPTGDPAGEEFVIPTTTTGDQTRPSAAALPSGAYAVSWTDASMTAPDTSGTAVRARIIYTEPPAGSALAP